MGRTKFCQILILGYENEQIVYHMSTTQPLSIIIETFQVIAESDFSRKTKKKLLWDNAMNFLNLDQTKF